MAFEWSSSSSVSNFNVGVHDHTHRVTDRRQSPIGVMATIPTDVELKRTLEELTTLSERKSASTDDEGASSRVEALALLSASTPHFAALKRINRRIHTDVQTQKTRIAEERAKVDSARLALQNLKYEEAMLELEVKVCQEFQSIFQDIELHPLEEFRSLHPYQSDDADEHTLMLARLRFELQERQRLEAEKQTLQVDRSAVVKENNEKKVKLEQAEKQLKDLVAAANAVRDKFESF